MKSNKTHVVAVVGPTASGKTRLAVELALRLNGEVISCDSMQIYRHMNIGTAKPTPEETREIPHHLIDIVEPGEEFSVADYVSAAREKIEDIESRGKLPIIAGGTGLYVDSLLQNIEFCDIKSDPALRAELKLRLKMFGPEKLHAELAVFDPELAACLHPNNTGRVIRAIEVFMLTGKTMTEQKILSRRNPPPYDTCYLGLSFSERQDLYERVDRRVDDMLKAGLLEEAAALRESGYSKTASQAIGYKELFGYLDGNQSLEEATMTLKRETRRYAKRQLTWFRRNENIHWLYMDDAKDYNRDIVENAVGIIQETFLPIL